MKPKKILSVLMAAGLAFTAVGCSSSSNSTTQNSNQPADYVAGVSLDKPIKVDKEAGTITVLSKINGKYFDEATRHNSVEQSGTNGAKSIFTPIKAEVTWNGADRKYDINEVVKDSNGKQIDFRFGGNLKRALDKNTGCLSCLDSCPVGIISNTTYTYGAVETRKEVKFTGNEKVLPEDGTYVAVIYSIKK